MAEADGRFILGEPQSFQYLEDGTVKEWSTPSITKQSNATRPSISRTKYSKDIPELNYKSGGRIHIKPENRGKFTEYCGGKVTDECIQRAKRSGNKKLIKRAVFAQNSRSWSKKHFLGGQLI